MGNKTAFLTVSQAGVIAVPPLPRAGRRRGRPVGLLVHGQRDALGSVISPGSAVPGTAEEESLALGKLDVMPRYQVAMQ